MTGAAGPMRSTRWQSNARLRCAGLRLGLTLVVLMLAACSVSPDSRSPRQPPATDVYLAQISNQDGQDQVVLLTLYPDHSGFISIKTLGQPPASGRLIEARWEWREDPQRLQLTPQSQVNSAPILFVPDGQGLMYMGERLTTQRLLLIRDRN